MEVADETTATSVTYAQPDGEDVPDRGHGRSGADHGRAAAGRRSTPLWPSRTAGCAPRPSPRARSWRSPPAGTDPFVKMSADGRDYAALADPAAQADGRQGRRHLHRRQRAWAPTWW